MSRSCQNLPLPPPSTCLSTKYPTPCSIVCCTPPVNYPNMSRVGCIQYRIAHPPQPKPIKTMVYLPPCPTCSVSSPPKIEMTYLPPTPPSSPRFYVCNTNCIPCPQSTSCNPPCIPPLRMPCSPC